MYEGDKVTKHGSVLTSDVWVSHIGPNNGIFMYTYYNNMGARYFIYIIKLCVCVCVYDCVLTIYKWVCRGTPVNRIPETTCTVFPRDCILCQPCGGGGRVKVKTVKLYAFDSRHIDLVTYLLKWILIINEYGIRIFLFVLGLHDIF